MSAVDGTVSAEERKAFIDFWSNQRAVIEGKVPEEVMWWFDVHTASNNVGYEQGQIRPGKLGQWDLYYNLWYGTGACDKEMAMMVAGLMAQEVANEEHRDSLREDGVNPDDPKEVAAHERLEQMSPEEVGAEIARLEARLQEQEREDEGA